VDFPAGVNPLTGLPAADPASLERRPLAIKITNFPRAVRPQWGLSRADVVYEYYLEHGLTRFVAIFYGKEAERVGPLRSARFFDEHIFRMYKSVFVFANADKRVLDHFLETEYLHYFVVERPDNCPPICRDRSNHVYNAYNNLMTDTRALTEYMRTARDEVDLSPPDLSGTRFEVDVPSGGSPLHAIAIHYSPVSYHRWSYDPGRGRFIRWQETRDRGDEGGEGEMAPLFDRLTGEQVTADNVITLLVPHAYYSERPEIVTMDLSGEGTAYALRDGQVFRVRWSRSRRDDVIRLSYPNGDPFPLKPGVTFYQVIGQSSRIWQLGDHWLFDFLIP
jgi:hypothetical protein